MVFLFPHKCVMSSDGPCHRDLGRSWEACQRPAQRVALVLSGASALAFLRGFSHSSEESIPQREMPREGVSLGCSYFPLDPFHSFPWSLSLPEEGASLLHSLHCRTVFLHSHAGPPDTSVPGAYGGLRKSCEYLPRGSLRPGAREAKGKSVRGTKQRPVGKDMPVLIICSLFNFHFRRWNQKVEGQWKSVGFLLMHAVPHFIHTHITHKNPRIQKSMKSKRIKFNN